MDGSHREVILRQTVRWPNGLTIDFTQDRLYWVDAKLHTVGSAGLDGAEARVVLHSPDTLRHPFSITVFEDLMYWSEWETHSIYQADKQTGGNSSLVTHSLSSIPMVVQLVHPYRQPALPNHCARYNGHCTHLCLPAPQVASHSPRTSCACPPHLALNRDGRTCSHPAAAGGATEPIPKRPVVQPAAVTSSSNSSAATEAPAGAAQEGVAVVGAGQGGAGVTAGLALGGTAATLLVAALALALLYRRRASNKLLTVKFQNPVFRRPSPAPAAPPSSVAVEPLCMQRQPGATTFVDLGSSQEMVQ